MKKLVENITIEIEEEKNQWAEKNEENNKAIEEMKAQNNLLQAQIKANNDTIDILEKTKDNELEKIDIKERELKAKIEKFVGAKIF